jgi:hypothetical protein
MAVPIPTVVCGGGGSPLFRYAHKMATLIGIEKAKKSIEQIVVITM